MNILNLPVCLDESAAFALASDFWATREQTAVTIHFAGLQFVTPFGLLVLSSELKSIASRRPLGAVKITGLALSNPAHSYLAHLGFFDHMGIGYGKKLGQAVPNERYVPILKLTHEQLTVGTEFPSRPIGHFVEIESRRLASVLTGKNDITVNRPIAYCLREIIRNTFEHANTNEAVICAQRWATGETEIAIVDRGRGIRNSLAERISTSDDKSAIELALEPGVSRSTPSTGEDEWANSGFGLYVLSELGRLCGSFTLCSGKAAVSTANGKTFAHPFHFHGTAIKLRIQKPKGQNLESIINAIVTAGERSLAGSGSGRRASKSSRIS